MRTLWGFSRRQKLKRAGHIAAKPVEKGEIVATGNPQRLSRGLPLAFLRQEAAEKRTALATGIRLGALGQRGRQGRRIFTLKPVWRIDEPELAVTVLRELADEPPYLPFGKAGAEMSLQRGEMSRSGMSLLFPSALSG